MRRIPGTIIQASDRRYVVDAHGSLRVLDYQAAPAPAIAPVVPVELVAQIGKANAPVETVLVAE